MTVVPSLLYGVIDADRQVHLTYGYKVAVVVLGYVSYCGLEFSVSAPPVMPYDIGARACPTCVAVAFPAALAEAA